MFSYTGWDIDLLQFQDVHNCFDRTKKIKGDAQQIKTAQRVDKKRDKKIIKIVTPKKRKSTKFDL